MLVAETPRLRLRWFRRDDAAMLVELLNDPDWLRYIGDRGVRTVADAQAFVTGRLGGGYWQHGLGMWAMERRDTGVCVGMCGLVRRPGLPDPDVGYALLPEHRRLGLVREAVLRTRDYALAVLGARRLLAIVSPQNERSTAVLRAVGMRRLGEFTLPNEDVPIDLYEWRAAPGPRGARACLGEFAARWRLTADNRDGRIPAVAALPAMFTPGAAIAAEDAAGVHRLGVRAFVEDCAAQWFGPLRNAHEHEIEQQTRVDGALAFRRARVLRCGERDGVPFERVVVRAWRLVGTGGGWRIAAMEEHDVPA